MSRLQGSRWLPTFGWITLVLTAACVVVLPAGWLAVVLAGVATLGLAADRRFGWLPAGLLVTIALPYGRGADLTPWTVSGYPVRPQDVAIGIALIGAVLALLRDRSRVRDRLVYAGASTFVAATGVFLLVGAAALAGGMLTDHAMRDVLRDARWWGLYVAAPLAVLGGTSRASLQRGLLLGATALAVVVLATAVGPVIEGGLKSSALIHDHGTLRMQFGNSIFLVPATGYAAHAALRRFGLWRLGWLALLICAQVLSLTRMSLLGTSVVVLLVGAGYTWSRRGLRFGRLATGRNVAAAVVALVVGFSGGIVASRLGTPASMTVSGTTVHISPEDPIHRITFGDGRSDITVIINSVTSGGRFATYLNVVRSIVEVPVQGRGFGQLVDVDFAYNESRAYTVGKQPAVDNAYLTVALKAGSLGVAAFGAMLLLPLVGAVRRARRVPRGWFVAGWLGILALMITQAFAISSYGPFGIALLVAVPFIGYARTSRSAAVAHR